MYDGWKILVISFLVSVAVAVVVCVLFFFFFVPYWEARTASVEVPKVTDLSVEEARTLLLSGGFLVAVEEIEDPRTPRGKVTSQDPPAGVRTKKQQIVRLKVSSGLETVEVPMLVGIPIQEAVELLIRKGLKHGETSSKPSASLSADLVISSEPKGGTVVPRGTTVDLAVSSGTRQVKVPRVLGRTLTAARTILEGSNLRLGEVNWVTSEEHAFDIVISQSPEAGTTVSQGSTVDITINREAY